MGKINDDDSFVFKRFQHWLDGDDLINSLAQGLGLSPDTLNDRT